MPEVMEEVIEELLRGLRDKETIVRWTAAKGEHLSILVLTTSLLITKCVAGFGIFKNVIIYFLSTDFDPNLFSEGRSVLTIHTVSEVYNKIRVFLRSAGVHIML